MDTLLAADGAFGDAHGFAVAISGDVALVGAPEEDALGTSAGAAYVYRLVERQWVQEAKLLADDGDEYDQFGWAVALDGNRALIGALGHDDGAPNAGAAYVYHFDGAGWTEEAQFTAPDAAEQDYFGAAVAIGDDIILIGALRDDDMGLDSGSVYAYRRDGTGWSFTAKLLALDGAAGDTFGYPIAIDGEVAIVGAHDDDDHGESSGSAYIFSLDDQQWTMQAKLTPGDGLSQQNFGRAVALDGDVAIIGAYKDGELGMRAGAAYVFRRVLIGSSQVWMEEAKLLADDADEWDRLGWSVAVRGDTAVVGAPGEDTGHGAVYVFQHDGASWPQTAKLTAAAGEGGDEFGQALSLDGPHAVFGAHGDDDNGTDAGSALIFAGFDDADCNDNDIPDRCDIIAGTSADENGNWIPDECESLAGDINHDGIIDVLDLLIVIAAWGTSFGPADVNGDGIVDVLDLVAVITNWS
jgi:hypothetical protein